MRKLLPITCMVIAVISMNTICFAKDSGSGGGKKYSSPKRFEKDIQRFETSDKKHPPPKGAILCIGSSSMRGWHGTIADDLAPLTVIPRGFGGSNMYDVLHYADRIVLPYKPRAIVVYEGDNDIVQGITPEKVADTFRAFEMKIQKKYPDYRIYFLSIKPSIKRWHLWPKMKVANSLIAAECAKDKRLTFVDVAAGMLDDKGNPRKEIFKADKLHMNRGGYVIWRDTLKPILAKTELQHELQKPDGSSKETSNKELKATGKPAP